MTQQPNNTTTLLLGQNTLTVAMCFVQSVRLVTLPKQKLHMALSGTPSSQENESVDKHHVGMEA